MQFDSVPYLQKPTYICQSDDAGQFSLKYIKEGEYYLFAIGDRNKNLKLDPGEKVAFLPEKVITVMTAHKDIVLKSFALRDTSCILKDKRYTYPGRIEFILSNPPDFFSVSTIIPLIQENTDRSDSLVYWLSENPSSKMRFFTELNGVRDTIRPIYKGVPESQKAKKPLTIESNVVNGKLLPGENLKLTFSEPVTSIDDTAIYFINSDSVRINLKPQKVNARSVEYSTFGSTLHHVFIDSAAVVSVFGNTNNAHREISFENQEDDYYGTVTINLDSLVEEKVLVELIDKKGIVVVDSVAYSAQMIFSRLQPGDYQLRLIFDWDNDGKWTSGSLQDGIIPEHVIYYTGEIKAKSKWEKEIDWNIRY